MEMFTTITPKFQVHIPVSIRKKMGLTKHGRATIKVKDSSIVIQPIKSGILSLGGKFSVQNPIPAENIRKFIDYSGGKR